MHIYLKLWELSIDDYVRLVFIIPAIALIIQVTSKLHNDNDFPGVDSKSIDANKLNKIYFSGIFQIILILVILATFYLLHTLSVSIFHPISMLFTIVIIFLVIIFFIFISHLGRDV